MNNGTLLFERERISNDYGLPAIVLSTVLSIGTGSVTNAPVSVNGTFLCAPVRNLVHDPVPLAASSLRSILHDTRSNFELNAVELAAVLGVSRQALYDWSAERAEPRVDKQRRMRELYALSAQWRTAIASHIETLNRKFSDKSVLIAILSDASLSTAAKSIRLEHLAQQRHGVVSTPAISDRLKTLGFKRDPEMQQRMLDEQGW